MPSIPVDAEKITIIAMSAARPAPARAELADGSTRVVPGQQATHKLTGVALWQVDGVIPGDPEDERSRATSITVKVQSATRPQVEIGTPVRFVELAVVTYNDQQTGRAALSWSASGVAGARARVQAAS